MELWLTGYVEVTCEGGIWKHDSQIFLLCGLLCSYFIGIGYTEGRASLRIELRSIHSIWSKSGQVEYKLLVKHHSITVEWVIGCDSGPQESLIGIWLNPHVGLVVEVG